MIFNTDAYNKFRKNSKNSIVIDCGHTPINLINDVIKFGRNGTGPSASQIDSVSLSLEIYKDLTSLGKTVQLNFCFSDVGYQIDSVARKEIKKRQNQYLIPTEYQSLIEKFEKPVDFCCNFQSVNSNKATAIIKTLKKKLKNQSCLESIIEFSSLFLVKDNCTFGILSPLLLTSDEGDCSTNYLFGPQFRLHDSDLIKDPLIRLKKSSFIGLYDKIDGILCLATYMGNLYRIAEKKDIISVYSRLDDENIGEKILGGFIAYSHISKSFSHFLSIVEQAHSTITRDRKEISLISSSDFLSNSKLTIESFSCFLKNYSNFLIYGHYN